MSNAPSSRKKSGRGEPVHHPVITGGDLDRWPMNSRESSDLFYAARRLWFKFRRSVDTRTARSPARHPIARYRGSTFRTHWPGSNENDGDKQPDW